jgi:AcrR family transcriptional regulator
MALASEPPRRPRNARGQGQVLREQLIEAAARLLATLEQPESLTLRQVAREVGVAPASIYSHFPDLGALFNYVLELRYREVAELVSAADRAVTPLAKLVQWCATYIRWGIEHPGEYRTLFGGRVPSGVSATSHHGGIELLDALTAALTAITDPGHHSPPAQRRQAGILLWTAMHGVISAFTEHPNLVWPPIDDLIVGIVALHTSRPQSVIAIVLKEHDPQLRNTRRVREPRRAPGLSL